MIGRVTAMMSTHGRSGATTTQGTTRQGSVAKGRNRDDDPRWADRDRDARERDTEVRHAFTRHLHLPGGRARELVHDRERSQPSARSES